MSASYLLQENRRNLVGRMRRLESFELATEVEPGRWVVAERAEATLKELGERGDVIKTMHRALAEHGLERNLGRYVRHGEGLGENIVGRVLAKGLAGDELSERVYVVIDGADGQVHHLEFRDPVRVDGVARGMIVEAAPAISGPRPADRNIAANAEHGLYRPSQHLERIRESFTQQGEDPDAYVRFQRDRPTRARRHREGDQGDRPCHQAGRVPPRLARPADRAGGPAGDLSAKLSQAPVDLPDIHPNMAEVYSRKIERLSEELGHPDDAVEAAGALREVIDRIVITPGKITPGKPRDLQITLHGDLGTILDWIARSHQNCPRTKTHSHPARLSVSKAGPVPAIHVSGTGQQHGWPFGRPGKQAAQGAAP